MDKEMKFAGFWVRLIALIFDYLIVTAVFFVMEKVSGTPFLQAFMEDFSGPVAYPIITTITLLAYFMYRILFVSSKWQATPGKRIVGIYIVQKEGEKRISFGQSLKRELSTLISFLILLLGYIMVAFTKEKESLHDIIASTRVVFGKPNN
jgi:uncharacterized RDD family membrane protein YckC